MEEPFKYTDTHSSRAKIEYLNRKFYSQKIAIIGLGGTGAYILDHIAKTPVREIHIFDADIFQLHNAFRAPGATSADQFEVPGGLKKVKYYEEIYSRMRNALIAHDMYVTVENIAMLCDFDFVFICVDKNTTRYSLTQELLRMKVTFIDVGLGVNKVKDMLIGTLRVTVASETKNDHLAVRIGADEFEENEYATNIQISDLNSLNANLAVIKWKKLSEFYQDLKGEHNQLYCINTNKLLNEDYPA